MRVIPSQAAATAVARRGIERFARLGYLAKGLVYATVGGLALRAALGAGGEITDAQGAIRELGEQNSGRLLLWLLAVGLIGYALWKVVQAVEDPEGRGTDPKGLMLRAGLLGSGALHGALALFTMRLLLGDGSRGVSTQSRTAELMSKPFGRWLVAILGLITLGVGLYQFVRANNRSFAKAWRTGGMSHAERTWACRVAAIGLAARGVVFSMTGWFFLRAAWEARPGEARGLSGVLAELASRPYGPYLLGAVAFGLVCYGVYCFAQARYRYILA